MSYETWHTYGIGVDMDEIRPKIDEKKLIKAIKSSNIMENITEKFDEFYNKYDKDIEETCNALSEDGIYGVSTIIAALITENNPGLNLVVCDNFEDTQYIVYCPTYPWNMNDFDKALTEEKLNEIFVTFFNTITKEIVTKEIVTDQSIENGG